MLNFDNKLNLRQNTVYSVNKFTPNPGNFTPSWMVWMVTFSKSVEWRGYCLLSCVKALWMGPAGGLHVAAMLAAS